MSTGLARGRKLSGVESGSNVNEATIINIDPINRKGTTMATRSHLVPTSISTNQSGSSTVIGYGVYSYRSITFTIRHRWSLEVDQRLGRSKDLRYGLKLAGSCNYMHFSLHLAPGYRHVINRQVHDRAHLYIFTNHLSQRKISLQ